MIVACYYKDKAFIDGHTVSLADECVTANSFYFVIGFLPYWFRFAQCLNKYHGTEQKVHLVNAGKYFSCLVSPTVQIFLLTSVEDEGSKYTVNWLFWLYFACHFVQTTYCYIWDIIMDWGLMRWNEKGKKNRFLREKINYSPSFYWWAIFSDFVLRYLYIVFLWHFGSKENFLRKIDAMFALSIFSEAFRRAQWALLRVENEQNNNLEAYRTIPIIPPIINSAKEGNNVQAS